MPVALTDAILFILFLGLFVLFGTTPVLPRLFALLGKLLPRPDGEKESGQGQESVSRAQKWRGRDLNDYEIILLRKLVMSRNKGLTRRELINSLYFKPLSVDRALKSLRQRGLIRVKKKLLVWHRFELSAAGQDYASERDMAPRYLLSTTGKSALTMLR